MVGESTGERGRSPRRPSLRLPHSTGVDRARSAIRAHLPETPLVRSELLSRALGAEVWLKNETVSPIASFKLRGALTALLRARDGGAAVEAVTSSTGNHGQGVAYAARAVGVAAHIFLPIGANPVKRRMIEALGATIHEGGSDIDEAKADAERFAASRGGLFVDDGESLDVMEGAGTVGLEIAERLPGIDVLYVPMGSGTLAVGCAVAPGGRQRGGAGRLDEHVGVLDERAQRLEQHRVGDGDCVVDPGPEAFQREPGRDPAHEPVGDGVDRALDRPAGMEALHHCG